MILVAGAGLLMVALTLSQTPAIKSRLAWRYEVARIYTKNLLHPVGNVPTAVPSTPQPTIPASPTITLTPDLVDTPVPATPTLAPPPAQALLASPPYEKQTPNNCGPAALSMMLHMFGWSGDQKTISDVIKPVNGDRNVNPEELWYWVSNYAGWLRLEYRVGGDLVTLKRLIAANYPVIIEGTTSLNPDDTGWPDDDLWAAHYLLLTGYDDTTQTFVAQDAYKGPDKQVPYEQVESEWKPFNYVYMIVYLPEQEAEVQTLLGSNWDKDSNRQHALELAQAATVKDPNDAFAWFNVGSNQSNRNDDLLALTDYALQRTDMSEETWLWHGWALYRKGDTNGAVENWRKALAVHPGYKDALYALGFVGATP
jgi:uncharacterized protein YvpB